MAEISCRKDCFILKGSGDIEKFARLPSEATLFNLP